jgi:hypothetical protein
MAGTVLWAGGIMSDKHVIAMTREEIIENKEPCTTAPNGTAAKCTCPFDCANYWLRAFGYKEGS